MQAGKPWAELRWRATHGRAEDEGWRVRKNGERFWARAVVTALYDAAGHLRGFAKVTQDLSARRHIQELESRGAAPERVHRHARPRDPQSARADPQRLAADGRCRPDDPVQVKMRRTHRPAVAQLMRIADDMIDICRITRGAFSVERNPSTCATWWRARSRPRRPAIEARGHA